MLFTALGVSVLAAPLLLVPLFSDRTKGFLTVFLADLAFQLSLALLTQAFGIFSYPVILGANLCVALLSVFFFASGYSKIPDKTVRVRWVAVAAFAIVFAELLFVRFDYSGPAATFAGVRQEKREYYPFPYFSDEWVGSSLVSYSMRTHSLPTENPLMDGNLPFPDPLVGFFSLLASLMLLLRLDPLSQFSLMAVFAGLFVCGSLYALLRRYGARSSISAFAVLSALFIACAGNLPGIWFLLPFVPSVGLLMICLACADLGESSLLWISSFLALVLYPPICVFVFPALAVHAFGRREKSGSFRAAIFAFAGIACAAGLGIFAFSRGDFSRFFPAIAGYVFRTNLVGGIPSFAFWNVFPLALIPFLLAGFFALFHRKKFPILAALGAGSAFWIAYCFTGSVFIIDYPRVAMIVSLLCIVAAGMGGEAALSLIQHDFPKTAERKIAAAFELATVFSFLIAACYYPIGTPWNSLPLIVQTPRGTIALLPAPPINHYLTGDDLRLFRGISGKRFVAPPWKGLVIGVATGNFPMESKPSIITNTLLSYDSFMKADCQGKADMLAEYKVPYAYAQAFSCKGFREIGASSEGLHLYSFGGLAPAPAKKRL